MFTPFKGDCGRRPQMIAPVIHLLIDLGRMTLSGKISGSLGGSKQRGQAAQQRRKLFWIEHRRFDQQRGASKRHQ
jgi:hypothetical protein